MPNQPIPVSQASLMVRTYSSYMQNLGVDMKTQTQSVCFSLTELMEWLNKMTPIADEIRIFMGDYPSADVKAGRTTVILWPYKDGEPARSTDATLAPESVEPDFGNEDEGTTSPAPGGGNPVNPYNDGKLMP